MECSNFFYSTTSFPGWTVIEKKKLIEVIPRLLLGNDLNYKGFLIDSGLIRGSNESIDMLLFECFDEVFRLYKEGVNILVYCEEISQDALLIVQSVLLNLQIENLEYPDIDGNLNFLKHLFKNFSFDDNDYLKQYLEKKIIGLYGF